MLHASTNYLFGDFSNNPAADTMLKAFDAEPRKFAKTYFMPNQQDTMLSYLRTWIHKRAGGGVKWGAAGALQPLPPRLPNDKVFDAYNLHTKSCLKCLQALKKIILLRNVTLILAATSLGFFKTASVWIRVVSFLLFSGATIKLEKLRSLFFVGEYSHQDND